MAIVASRVAPAAFRRQRNAPNCRTWPRTRFVNALGLAPTRSAGRAVRRYSRVSSAARRTTAAAAKANVVIVVPARSARAKRVELRRLATDVVRVRGRRETQSPGRAAPPATAAAGSSLRYWRAVGHRLPGGIDPGVFRRHSDAQNCRAWPRTYARKRQHERLRELPPHRRANAADYLDPAGPSL